MKLLDPKCVRVRKAIATAELGKGVEVKKLKKRKISGSWSDVSGSGHVVWMR
jgi:hypothetical protein